MDERVKEMQDVYDLIIATCEHNPQFKGWGASALRYLNAREREGAASADTRPEGGDSTKIEAPFTGGAVPEGQTPK